VEEEVEFMENLPVDWFSYFPQKVLLDKSGKRKDWEAIIRLAPISLKDFNLVYQHFTKNTLTDKERKRNLRGKSFSYRHDPTLPSKSFLSIYGNIEMCQVRTDIIIL
jgi:5'-3' exonuclease